MITGTTPLIKGTTPIHIFKIPLKANVISNIEITYSQLNEVIFRKGVTDCTIADEMISVRLTQEDTLKFNHRQKVQIQIRILTVDKEVMSSRVMVREVEQCLSGEVLR